MITAAFKNIENTGIVSEPYGAAPGKRLDFVIGIANKGHIIVWLRGKDRERVLIKHMIMPHEPSGDDTYYNGRLSMDVYLETVFPLDSSERAAMAGGVDARANYIDTPSRYTKCP